MKRRLLPLLLVLVLLLGMIPVSAYADDGQPDAEETAAASEASAEETAAEEDEIEAFAEEKVAEEIVEEVTEEIICQHTEFSAACEAAEEAKHTITETCVCGEEMSRTTEACLDEDEDLICDACKESLPCEHTDLTVSYAPGQLEQTHLAETRCNCGTELEQVLESCRDEDGNGLCDGCEVQLEVPVALGDVNADGIIDEEDAMCILRYVVGFSDDIDRELADVDGDGIISAIDATFILRYCAGKIEAFPAEE